MSCLQANTKLLIFTDLDGCLLGHDDYGFATAVPILQKLEQLEIPVIPNSSKTEAELLYLRKFLDNQHPFIIENGAAVYLPKHVFLQPPTDCGDMGDFWLKKFTSPRADWQALIAQSGFASQKFKTFADCSVAEIAHLTDLDPEAANRAVTRQYGEPVAWHGSLAEKEGFIRALKALGANVLQGGRFLHVSGACSKAKAMHWLTEQYAKVFDFSLTTVAIGDSQNDVSMLEAADIAVLIPSPSHPLPRLNKTHNVYTASQTGPSGWAEAISMLLHMLNIH